jgi:hypothetical protein
MFLQVLEVSVTGAEWHRISHHCSICVAGFCAWPPAARFSEVPTLMKVSIDPVETFFSGISSTWGRALAFFGTCWVSFGFGFVCSSVSWRRGWGFEFEVSEFEHWFVLPIGWMYSIVAICLLRWWWGVPHGIYLAAAFYAVMILETDLFRSMLVLFIAESWHAMFCVLTADHYYLDHLFDIDGGHPLLPFMLLMNAHAGWHVYDSWRNDRREPVPP